MKKLSFLTILIGVLASGVSSWAQTFDSLSAPAGRVATCAEFFTSIDKPVDMDSTRDINRYIPDVDVFQFSSVAIANGVFTGVSSSVDSRLYLLSPRDCGAHAAGGRWGSEAPIDTTKYTRFSMRMFTNVASSFQLSWNQDCSYQLKYLVTKDIPTKVGWHTYVVDLPNQPVISVEGGVGTWSSLPATSFRIDPTSASGATVMIDWARLEDPTTCGNGSATSRLTAPAGYTVSLFADDDTNLVNGFTRRLAKDLPASTTSTNLSSSGIRGGTYNLTGWLTDDYASTYGDPWDFADSNDVVLTADVTNLGFSNDTVTGTSPGGAPSLYLRTYDDGIDTSRFRFLSVKVTQSAPSPVQIFWSNGTGFGGRGATLTPNNDGVYVFDLGTSVGWTSLPRVTEFVVRPLTASGTFSVQYVTLTASAGGYKTTQPVPISRVSTAPLTVNSAPYASLLEPSQDGGEAFQVWNFRSTDEILEPANLTGAEILPYNLIDGRVGSFFTALSKTNDPVFYLRHPFRPVPSILIDADRFHKLSWGLYVKDVANRIDILNGSVIRVVYRDPVRETLFDGDDIIHIIDGWGTSGWYDFTIDMKTYRIDTGPTTTRESEWKGSIDGLRIDPHEFTDPHRFYFNRAALRAADEGQDKFVLPFDAVETDGSDNPTVRFYANSSNSTNGGTLLGMTTLSANSRVFVADTSGLAEGTYYIYVEIADGANSVSRLAKGELKINRSLSADTTAPTLNVRTPSDGLEFSNYMPVEGYAFDQKFAAVEVHLDDVWLSTFKPNSFDIAAATNETSQEAPYSGFERSLDTTFATNGRHTLTIRAYDTSGNVTTKQFAVVKSPGAAPGFSTKPEPNSQAVPVPGASGPALPGPTATTQPQAFALSLKVVHAKDGKITLVVGKVPSSACTLTVSASETAGGAQTLLKSVQVKKVTRKTRTVTVTGKIQVAKKKLPSVFLTVQSNCGGAIASTRATQMKFKTTKGAATYAAAIEKMKKLSVQKAKTKPTRGRR